MSHQESKQIARDVLASLLAQRPSAARTASARLGWHRLAIFAAALAGSAYLIALTLAALDHPGAIAWRRFILFLLITTPLVSALAWLLIRGLAWVCAGFARRRSDFSKPNWN